MKKISVLLIVLIFCLTSCVSRQKQDIIMYNTQTEATVSLYDSTVEKYETETENIIWGCIKGTLSEDYIDSNYDYSDITKTFKDSLSTMPDYISDSIYVTSSRFYTSLGANSVTEIILFNLKGNSYLLEILWVDMKISNMVLEVL